MQQAPGQEDTGVRWLLPFVRARWPHVLLVLVLSCAATGLALAQPWLTKLLIDDGLLARRADVVALMCALMVGAVLLGTLLEGVNRLAYVRLSAGVLFALRETVYRHLQRLSPTYYARMQSGEILSRLDGDVAEVQRFAVDGPLALINAVFALAVSVALMLGLSAPLTVLALAAVPLQLLLLKALRPRLERTARRLRESNAAVSSFLVETLWAMKFIQSSAAEEREAQRLKQLNADYLQALQASQLTGLAAGGVPRVLNAVATALVFGVGGYLVVQDQLSVGALIAFSAYMLRAAGPVQSLFGLYAGWQRARVSLGRVGELTREAPAVATPPNPEPWSPTAKGELAIDCVRFGYGSGEAVLRDASLTIPGGSKVVLSGASGAGKSTLMDLLLRHYDPHAGCIRLDGVDLRQADLAELRRRVVVVSQDTVLFPGSLADNLRYGRPLASAAECVDAARTAGLDLAAFPRGLDAPVGTAGAALSGGERQRLSIARALLRDPLVLILDEATSAVDADTARQVIAAVDRLFAGRTRIVITHQPALAGACDLRVHLADGRLAAVSVEAAA